jgi:enoyl-CoA hydratase
VTPSDTIFSAAGQVATFTLNRPETGHAMTWAMYDALMEACDRVDSDPAVRVFVIRATGGVFCTGTDIRQFAAFTSTDDGLEYERRLDTCVTRLESVGVPTIAQVDGIAAGAGCVMALACDLRVCTAAARFGVPIARTLGNALSLANCARLVEHLGLSRTKDLLLTGRLVDATEASAAGLATRVAEPADVERVVSELAATIGRNAPLTLRSMKQALARLSRRPQPGNSDDLLAACYGSHDFREGIAAFLEKRAPKFTGR